jgi:hypothetical protein
MFTKHHGSHFALSLARTTARLGSQSNARRPLAHAAPATRRATRIAPKNLAEGKQNTRSISREEIDQRHTKMHHSRPTVHHPRLKARHTQSPISNTQYPPSSPGVGCDNRFAKETLYRPPPPPLPATLQSHHGATQDPFDSRHLSCYNPTAFARTEDGQSRNRDGLHD